MTMDKDGFIAAVVKLWREHDFMDIDGCSFQDLLIKHGLASEGPATEQDCKTDWAQEFAVEPGDQILTYHPVLMALMKERAA